MTLGLGVKVTSIVISYSKTLASAGTLISLKEITNLTTVYLFPSESVNIVPTASSLIVASEKLADAEVKVAPPSKIYSGVPFELKSSTLKRESALVKQG